MIRSSSLGQHAKWCKPGHPLYRLYCRAMLGDSHPGTTGFATGVPFTLLGIIALLFSIGSGDKLFGSLAFAAVMFGFAGVFFSLIPFDYKRMRESLDELLGQLYVTPENLPSTEAGIRDLAVERLRAAAKQLQAVEASIAPYASERLASKQRFEEMYRVFAHWQIIFDDGYDRYFK